MLRKELLPANVTVSTSRRNGTRRLKLAAQVSAQLEGGIKLTLNHSCPPSCHGPDHNVTLFEPGVAKLMYDRDTIGAALQSNQHYNDLLETNIDPQNGTMDYVSVKIEPDNKVIFHHTRVDLLQTNSVGCESSRGLKTQTVTLNQKAFDKLAVFLTRYSTAKAVINLPSSDEDGVVQGTDGGDGDELRSGETTPTVDDIPLPTVTTTDEDGIVAAAPLPSYSEMMDDDAGGEEET
jgi:hypothetical protein